MKENHIRIGIDIGGTFTDLMVINLLNMEMYETKVPSTPANLFIGIKEGINEIMTSLGLKGDEVKLLVHGTTAALNALIERMGAKTALITTEGFIDIMEIGELYRPRELEELKLKHACVGDVRSIGLFASIEMVKNKQTKEPLIPYNAAGKAGKIAKEISDRLLSKGLYTLFRWMFLSIAPPLSITEEQLRRGLNIIDDVLDFVDTLTEN